MPTDAIINTVTLTLGEMLIAESLTINAPTTAKLTIDAANQSRQFRIDDGAASKQDVSLNNLTLINGNSRGTGGGGAIQSHENLTLVNSTISGSTVSGTNFGGAIYHRRGLLTIRNSTLSGNMAYSGGGLINYPGTGAVIENSTISGNTVTTFAGDGIYNQAPLTIRNSTITNNTSNFAGGGTYSRFITSAAFVIQNSIIAGNKQPNGAATDLFGTTPTLTNSLVGVNTNTTLTASPIADSNGNLIGSAIPLDAKLGPLQNNGGMTLTHAHSSSDCHCPRCQDWHRHRHGGSRYA